MTRILSIAAAVLSVVALVVALTAGSSTPEEDSAAPAPSEARARSSGDLEARLGAVEMHLSSLLRRVDALERAQSAGQAAVAAPRASEPVEEDVAVLDRQQLKETVRQVQDEVRAERLQVRSQAREDRRAERLQRFYEEARVTPTQQDQIREILAQEAAQLRGTASPGRNREAARETVRAARRNADEAIGRVLNEEQAELFKQVRHDERPQRPSRRLDLREGVGSGAGQGARSR